MNKKLGRLLQPDMGGYLIVMLVFAVATALFQNYLLAAFELLVTAAVLVMYHLHRTNRRKKLQKFLQHHLDELSGTRGTRSPFPMLVVRPADGGIVYAMTISLS